MTNYTIPMTEQDFHIQISRELGGIHENLKSLSSSVKGIETHLSTQNGRIRKTEDEIGGIKAKAALIASTIGSVAYFVWDFIKVKIIS